MKDFENFMNAYLNKSEEIESIGTEKIIEEGPFDNKNEKLNELFHDFCRAYSFETVREGENNTQNINKVGKIQDDYKIIIERPTPEDGYKLFNKKVNLIVTVIDTENNKELIKTNVAISSKMEVKDIVERINKVFKKVPGLTLKTYGTNLNKKVSNDDSNELEDADSDSGDNNSNPENKSKFETLYNNKNAKIIIQRLTKVLSEHNKKEALEEYIKFIKENNNSDSEQAYAFLDFLKGIQELTDDELNSLITLKPVKK